MQPVAVTFARITHVLAIGVDQLQAEDCPAFTVPVHLGDSVHWGREQHLFSAR